MRANGRLIQLLSAICLALPAMMAGVTVSSAQQAAVAISVKGHQFQPAEVHAPANKPLSLHIKNLDGAAMEFESVSLRVEKVVAAGSEGVINVRALSPGRYEFFDDFHQQTRGVLVVQ
jgi:Cupredoxin-like domain